MTSHPVRGGPALPSAAWTRRAFLAGAGVAAAGLTRSASVADPAPAATASAAPAGVAGAPDRSRYRAVSWWLTFDDLAWPNRDLHDAIRRRADRCAASGVNCCLIFGAHFRWDFLPLWERLHDLLRTVAAELHERRILLFDHHSSVLTHRPPDAAAARAIAQRNRHHVPFYPSREAAAAWTFAGSHLNDWRMLEVETGRPVYLPAYEAEQFCMNHPAFAAAYAQYVRRLVADTGIDGLMSDDGIFYADWRACGCPHCRARFRREYGRELPPTADAAFWGNRRNAAWRDWIELRFRSSGDFLAGVRAALPAGLPLLTCCSSSDGHALPGFGMSYQDYVRSCDHVLLEMVGSTPTPAGTWDNRIPSQLLHLGLAREHRLPCLGLGYGFFPDTAFFVWALNKFLGSDCWFSTLKGRLDASAAQLATLGDDADLVAEGFRWERDHPSLFAGEPDHGVAVLFSRATRDFHGQLAADYSADYQASCLHLLRGGVMCVVVTGIPLPTAARGLVLASTVCLSAAERRALAAFLEAGGTVVATGPCGFCDERGQVAPTPWLHEYGVAAAWENPDRPGGFPPYRNLPAQPAVAETHAPAQAPTAPDGWLERAVGAGRLCWHPQRITRPTVAAGALARLRAGAPEPWALGGLPTGWVTRRFRTGTRWLVHGLPARVTAVLHPELRNQMGSQPVVERLDYAPLETEVTLRPAAPLAGVTLHSPDLSHPVAARAGPDGVWRVRTSGIRRYFILEAAG